MTAREKPRELDKYLFMDNFSLQTHVTKKSITIPDKPTRPNLIIFKTVFIISNVTKQKIYFTTNKSK